MYKIFVIFWEAIKMKCPFCGNEMITGDVLCKIGSAPTLYPKEPGSSELKHFFKMFFGSKSSIKTSDLDQCWYCSRCKKILAVWNER